MALAPVDSHGKVVVQRRTRASDEQGGKVRPLSVLGYTVLGLSAAATVNATANRNCVGRAVD